jgi:predicted CopG family antitoxin
MKTISLTDATYRRLLQRAESFEDTAEDVILRLLEHEHEASSNSTTRRPLRGRATPGTILPQREYWPVILDILIKAGGKAPANDVIDAVGERMRASFLPADLDELDLGEVRWRNRVRFARLRLKEGGLLRSDSPRGVWEITDRGREFAATTPARAA